MKLTYDIECRHCGAHTHYTTTVYYPTLTPEQVDQRMHIDTECAIRCPACRYRLNTTEADFRSQVHISREA